MYRLLSLLGLIKSCDIFNIFSIYSIVIFFLEMIALYLSLRLQILARGMLTIFSVYSFYDLYLFFYQNLYIFFLHMIFYRRNKYNLLFYVKMLFISDIFLVGLG